MASQKSHLQSTKGGSMHHGGDPEHSEYFVEHEVEPVGLASFAFLAPGINDDFFNNPQPRTTKRPFAATFREREISGFEAQIDRTPSSTHAVTVSLEEAHILPPKILRDELVLLYFRHIHPLCPFIDEYKFSEAYYSADSDEELLEKIDICLFQAMMFTAFTHASDDQIRRSSYDSLPNGQKSLIGKAKVLYRAHPLHSVEDHITLIQVTLLLSYWSPCDSDPEVNRYWVDRALHHASEVKIWAPECDTGTMSCRNRILWWCCLTRDRLTSTGLRTPTRLQETGSKIPLINVEDYGLESVFPRFMTAESKNVMMSSFIWLCKLSDIMMSITIFLKEKYSESQQGPRDFAMPVEEINKVRALETQLEEWTEEYRSEFGPSVSQNLPSYCKMQLFSLQIINSSLSTNLYLPYIKRHSSGDPLVENFRLVAMRRIKEASAGVGLSIHGIMTQTTLEDFPVLIVAWLSLPICFFEVKRSTAKEPASGASIDHLAEMHKFLNSIKNRFGGARFVAQLMSEMGDVVAATAVEHAQYPVKRRMSSNQGKAGKLAQQEDLEADILDIAAKFVDLKVSSNIVGRKE